MKCPKISNPNEFVELTFEDKGDIQPIYDKNGMAYEAYTTFFSYDGVKLYSFTDKERCAFHPLGAAEARFKSDCDFLMAHDLDLAKAMEMKS